MRFIEPWPLQLQSSSGTYYCPADYAWLTKTWREKNQRMFPTPREIMSGLVEEARGGDALYSQDKSLLVDQRINALIALFQITGLSEGASIDTTLSTEALHDPGNKIAQGVLFLHSLETFLPTALNKAIRQKDECRVRTLGPYAVALRQVVLGAEAGKGRAADAATCWRPVMLYQRDLSDYLHLWKARKERAFVRNMGFFSALSSEEAALSHLCQVHNDYKTATAPHHETLLQEGIPSSLSWLRSDPAPRVLALFKIVMSQGMDYFCMDDARFSAYFPPPHRHKPPSDDITSEQPAVEIVVQDATKFLIAGVR